MATPAARPRTICRSQSTCSGSGSSPDSPRNGSSSATITNRITPRKNAVMVPSTNCRIGGMRSSTIKSTLMTAPTSTAYQSTSGISVITPVSRCCRACTKLPKAPRTPACTISCPPRLRLEARQPQAHGVGPVGAAVQEVAAPVRVPVLVDGEQHVVAQHRLHLRADRLGIARHVGIERRQRGRLVEDALLDALVVLEGRDGQQAQQQAVEQVEPGGRIADRVVEIGAGAAHQQPQHRLHHQDADEHQPDGHHGEIDRQRPQRDVVHELGHCDCSPPSRAALPGPVSAIRPG